MDYPNQLAKLTIDIQENATSTLPLLKQWNEQIEEFLAAPPSSISDDSKDNESFTETVREAAATLHRGIVCSIINMNVSEDNLEESTESVNSQYLQLPPEFCPDTLFEYTRAAKNLLRWYIQVFLAKKGVVLPSAVATLQSLPLVLLLVTILEQHALHSTTVQQEFLRNIALYLFYATYTAFPSDESAKSALHHLNSTHSFPKLALRILNNSCSTALALALIRNIHNVMVTSPDSVKSILAISIPWDPKERSGDAAAPWQPKERTNLEFRTTCTHILLWAVTSEPPFPGDDADKRSELVVEILGVFYAIRLGQKLASNDDLARAVVMMLRLPDNTNTRQCKLSIISLLMDSVPGFGDFLLQMDCIANLLEIFQIQVSEAVDGNRIDNAAIAGLVPILVVLHKYSNFNKEIKRQIKEFIFPIDAEEEFQKRASEQRVGTSKNMAPLDAPKGTFRQKLISLLTSPAGHIKRCTGELLWTLCSSNPTEFVHRVGFGNGLPLLSAKGFAKMPVSS